MNSSNIDDMKTKQVQGTHYFLEGPHSILKEYWFVIKVFFEFLKGLHGLHKIGPSVTVFGSARFDEDHHYYKLGMQIGAALSKIGFTVMTGGGPGVMEAANRGAREAGGRSVGSNIFLSEEQLPNRFMDKWVTFKFFFIRKVLLFKYSYAFVVLPGGAGTMDELFETLTLIQTKTIENFPIVLMGMSYWQPLLKFLNKMVYEGTIDGFDLTLIKLTDSVDAAIKHIEKYTIENEEFGLRKRMVL